MRFAVFVDDVTVDESRAFCPDVSPPDNSCSPANKGTGRPPPVPPDRSRLISDREAAKYTAESRDWLAENGVQLTVDFDPDFDPASTVATVDAVEAAVLGVEALSLAGIEPPQSINIGNTSSPASAAQYDPDLDTITIRMNQDREMMRSNISRNWLVGDPANVFSNLVIHETTHRDHWIAMDKDETLWEQRCGYYDFERQKKEAEIAGRPFRPSADLVRQYAWDAKYRTGDATVDLPATRAIDIARRVSEYATTDPLEFVAEVRTGVALGNSYDDEVMALYEDYDGPPLGRRRRR